MFGRYALGARRQWTDFGDRSSSLLYQNNVAANHQIHDGASAMVELTHVHPSHVTHCLTSGGRAAARRPYCGSFPGHTRARDMLPP